MRERFAKLAAVLDPAEADVLAFMDFPVPHRAKLHSTNPLERLKKEIKRWTDVGRDLPERSSVVFSFLLEQQGADTGPWLGAT